MLPNVSSQKGFFFSIDNSHTPDQTQKEKTL